MQLCYEGKLSLYCYLSSAVIVVVFTLADLFLDTNYSFSWQLRLLTILSLYLAINVVIRKKFQKNDYQIAVRAAFLGVVLATCVTVIISCPAEYKPFGIYGTFMSIFHYTEFLGIALSNPQTLTPESFILNHSVPYVVAAVASWVEFSLEVYFVPQMKVFRLLWAMGATMCFSGELLRKISMITASKSFSHLVQFTRNEDHILITHGVYSLMRHPSYVGWFWWSIGTQVILANPICTIVYTLTSWKFFNDRIYMEEITLLSFFGEDYYKYQQMVPTGLPFIRGYKIEL